MRDPNRIIEEYQKADFEKRLNLFLECPPLRSEFVQMEQDEASAQDVHVSQPGMNQNPKRKSVFYPCKRLLKCCHSLID